MKILFYTLGKILKVTPLKLFTTLTRQNTVFPFYHAVSNSNPVHIKHLYKVRTEKDFEKDLDFLLKNFKPIYYTDITSTIYNKTRRKNSFLLSFDDGLREFYDVAAPILKRKGIPATCFLNTEFIDNKNLFYRYKASILVEKLRTTTLPASTKNRVKAWFQRHNLEYGNSYGSLLQVSYRNREWLNNLSELIEYSFKDFLTGSKPYLTGDQIRSLTNQGFTFGAHSIDHPRYEELNPDDQVYQTQKSLDEITRNFNLNYRLFSFPFADSNVPKTFFDRIFTAENPIADFTFGSSGLKKDLYPKNIQRIPMELKSYTAQEIIYGEYLYYITKFFLRKNTIKRR